MKYIVLCAKKFSVENSMEKALETLETKVNGAIKNGWKPQGGVSIDQKLEGELIYTTVAQAMVKED